MWQRCLVWTVLQKIYGTTLSSMDCAARDLCDNAVARDLYGNAVKYGQLMCTRTDIQMQCCGHWRLMTSL